MYYDYAQVRRDIMLVTQVLGGREQEGFFTVARYRKGHYILTNGLGTQNLVYRGKEVNLSTLSPTLGIGKWLIERAIAAEEVSAIKWNFDHMTFDPKTGMSKSAF